MADGDAAATVARAAADRRDDLVRAAGRAIGRKGIDGVRLLDVAREAGASIGALQHHFETRDALVVEAVEAIARDSVDSVREAADRHPDDAWAALVDVVKAVAPNADPRLDAAIWSELCAVAARGPEFRPAVQYVHEGWRAAVARIVERGAGDGTFALRLSPEDTVAAILAAADGVMLSAASAAAELTPGELERRVLAMAGVIVGRQ